MKLRLGFSKQGNIKFVGHLDLLRLFQRVIKSAHIPIAYSQGFNPHSLLYFAQALSVGITSTGEYMDIQLDQDMDPEKVKEVLNTILPEGLEITTAHILVEGSKTCMAVIDAANYTINIVKSLDDQNVMTSLERFYKQKEIPVTRVSKKKSKTINIKEFIYDLSFEESETHYVIDVTLATGSRKNLNANLFIEAFIDDQGVQTEYHIHRTELFSSQKDKLIPLRKLGA